MGAYGHDHHRAPRLAHDRARQRAEVRRLEDVRPVAPDDHGALEGITQNSVSTIAADLGFEVVVDNIARSDLYIAEEAFVCGTAAEVSSINSVDDRDIACPGPMTVAIAEVYHEAIRAKDARYKDWCELVH